MTPQRKIAVLLTLTCSIAAGEVGPRGPAVAADPQEQSKAIEKNLDKASKESLDLLRRDAAKARPDWMVVATASASGWDFTVLYAKGKGLPQPGDAVKASSSNALPLTDLVLPQNASVGLHVTSNDDIQPFVVPGLNLKTEALPGRIQVVPIDTATLGAFPSTCADACVGSGKGMAFTIHVVDSVTFHRWRIARDVRAAELRPPVEVDEFSGATCAVSNRQFSIRDVTKSISVSGGDSAHFTFKYGTKIGSGKLSNIYSIGIEGTKVIVRLNDTFTEDPVIRRIEFRNLPERCVHDIDAVTKSLRLSK
jgi:heme/copper-type cytochrome/quinol oxidase subunit 2